MPTDAHRNPMDRPRVILSGLVVCAIGALYYNLLPLIVGVAQDDLGFGDRQVGLLTSVFFAGFTLTTLTAFFWIRRVSWRLLVGLALPLSIAALALTGMADSQGTRLAGLFLTGCAFSTLYGVGTTSLGDTTTPARWYGLKISAEALAGALLLFVLPGTLVASYGFAGLMAGMALTVVVLAALAFFIPAHGAKEDPGSTAIQPLPTGLRSMLLLALLGVTAFIFSATMIWAFVERIAADAGYDPVATGKVLSLTLLFAVGGSLTAVVLGDRFGTAKPLAGACLALLIALAWLFASDSFTQYAASACLLTWAIALGITYSITAVADLDLDGRFIVLTVPAIGVGVMAAPAVGGWLSSIGGFTPLFITGALTTGVALIAGLVALSRGGKLLA